MDIDLKEKARLIFEKALLEIDALIASKIK